MLNLIEQLMIIHPSRGRPQKARNAMTQIISSMSTSIGFTYYLSLDDDDLTLNSYRNIFAVFPKIKLVVGNNPHEVVQATNRAAEKIQAEKVILCHTDDYFFGEGWDKTLFEFIKTINTDIFLIHFPSVRNAKNKAIPQVLSAGLYKKLGYVFYPKYVSMYADDDLYHAAKSLDAVYSLRDWPMEHRNPVFGFGRRDDTGKRTNRPEAFRVGRRVLKDRRTRNFKEIKMI